MVSLFHLEFRNQCRVNAYLGSFSTSNKTTAIHWKLFMTYPATHLCTISIMYVYYTVTIYSA